MQDFTKLNNPDLQTAPVTPNEYGGLYDKQKQLKKGFIEARLNKDNFWNLVFAVGMTFGLFMAPILSKLHPLIGTFFVCSTIFGIPFIVRKQSKVTFSAEKVFLNSQDQDITSRIPSTLVWLIIFTFGITALTGNILDNHGKHLSITLGSFIISFALFFSFSLYFILINCPLAVLFSRDIWTQKRSNVDYNTYNFRPKGTGSLDSSGDYFSTTRSYLARNIHHSSR